MLFLQKLAHYFRLLHGAIRAKTDNWLVRREVVKVLRVTHAQELYNTPRNEWAIVKQAQAREIQAVIDGKTLDIIDRRSWAYPYLPEALHRLNQPVLKNTPYNLRRFSETPIPRRAINLVKNGILSLDWEITPISDEDDITPERELRIRIATECLKRPNNVDSFRELLEAFLEDLILGGYGTLEPRVTPYAQRPVKIWAVDGSTIRIFLDWTESTPDRPRYAQMTGLKGERGIVTFLDSELVYVRDNVRTSTPFGMGKVEVCFNTINAFLGAQQMASAAGADQVHKTWLWWTTSMMPGHIQTIRRHIINELEGQAKISLMAGAPKPEVIDVKAVTPEDLLLDWQRFLLDVIAAGFDLSPLALGQTDKVNKATGQVMADSDYRSSVVPMAKRVEEAFTRQILQGFLGWKDLQFKFIGLEDPDMITRTTIQARQWAMNSITPDEIRKTMGKPPLPGGWGRLTMYQMQILLMESQAKMMGKVSGGGATGGKMGMSTSMGLGTSGMGLGTGGGQMGFAADEVANMSPNEIQLFQELGLLPPGAELPDAMEQEQPGILETISDELRQFFDQEKAKQEESEVQPANITPSMQKNQQQLFDESEHQESLAEKTINRRGTFGPGIDQQYRKNPERGKYPRSGGRFQPDPGEARALDDQLKKDVLPRSRNRRIGKGNLYK